ncbi:hypothetical protein RYX56_12540 [Alkalihalophilus lindianensis]|uniref:YobI-like P-loop NTPase domain-containing protein n=1 Tax=Alkalihalophilus lindianensis TaxID=1630542 RepID=A0ABU3XCN0_9BACI|nr:hypothetical protein [Alkalihalophilus lindianensis]MDV2685184.1 hypothetical protein [Alkalihalophilus lindianensis]
MSEESFEIELEKLETLTPDKDYDEKKINYISTIDWAIKNDEIQNIAITGSYGSGKSSIINTFIERHPKQEEIIDISVASFNSEYKNKLDIELDEMGESKNNITVENLLEQYIMQQMFYKVSPAKIPLSRFSRIIEKESIKASEIFYSIILILLIYIFFKYNIIDYFILDFINEWNYLQVGTYFPPLILIGGFIFVVWRINELTSLFRNITLRRLEVGSAAIDITPKESPSIFNRYIDELIYFFKSTEYRILIFEDLDRFNNLEIFERLRDLNNLLNNNEELKDRKIVFIYALRDDIFSFEDTMDEAQNRTKFFDFIIPTVKIVNSSNSENILLKNLGGDKNHNISNQLIQATSLYINDMRLLKNICNEFYIMKATLNNNYLDDSKIFSMTIYKNIYPKDYIQLLNNQGILFDIFNNNDRYYNNVSEDIKNSIEDLRQVLSNIPNEIAETVEELRYLFLHRRNINDNNLKIKVKGTNKTFIFSNVKGFEDFLDYIIEYRKENANITLVDVTRNFNNSEFSLEDFVTINGKFSDISISYKSVKVKLGQNKEKIQEKIKSGERELYHIKSFSLNELYSRYKAKTGINFYERDLLRYLVIDGWIDENYNDYLTYFYEGVLPKSDIDFTKSFYTGDFKKHDYKLKNVPRLLKKIPGEKLNSKGVFNYYFLNYLFSKWNSNITHSDEERAKRKIVSEYIDDNVIELICFLNEYVGEKDNYLLVSQLIKSLEKSKSIIWKEIISNGSNELDYINVFIEMFNKEELSSFNHCSVITRYISESSSFLKWKNIHEVKDWGEKLEYIGVKFIKLEHEENINALEIITRLGLYELNFDMLQIILGNPIQITYEHVEKNSANVAERIEEEMDNFVKALVHQSNYIEREEYLIRLLDHPDVENENKKELIKKWDGLLRDLEEIKEEELLAMFISQKKAEPNWNNILHYLRSFGNRSIKGYEELISFITYKSNIEVLRDKYNDLTLSEHNKEQLKMFNELLLISPHLNRGEIERLLFFLTPSNKVDIELLNIDRVRTLVEFNLLELNPTYYKTILDQFEDIKLAATYLNFFVKDRLIDVISMPLNYDVFYEILKKVEAEYLIDIIDTTLNRDLDFDVDKEILMIILNRVTSSEINNNKLFNILLTSSSVTNGGKIFLLENHSKLNIQITSDAADSISKIMSLINISMRNDLLESILNSALVDDEVIESSLTEYVDQTEFIEDSVFSLIAKRFYEIGRITLEKDTYLRLLKKSKNERIVARLLLIGINQFNIRDEDYYNLMSSLNTKHKQLSLNGERNKTLTYFEENLELIRYLADERKYVSSFTENDEKITFNVSRNFNN